MRRRARSRQRRNRGSLYRKWMDSAHKCIEEEDGDDKPKPTRRRKKPRSRRVPKSRKRLKLDSSSEKEPDPPNAPTPEPLESLVIEEDEEDFDYTQLDIPEDEWAMRLICHNPYIVRDTFETNEVPGWETVSAKYVGSRGQQCVILRNGQVTVAIGDNVANLSVLMGDKAVAHQRHIVDTDGHLQRVDDSPTPSCPNDHPTSSFIVNTLGQRVSHPWPHLLIVDSHAEMHKQQQRRLPTILRKSKFIE